MKFGYVRVSPNDQDKDIQTEALKNHGIDKLYIDIISDSNTKRPELKKLNNKLKKGDTIVIYSLDKLGITIKQLLYLTEELHRKGISLVSIKENIDPNTKKGEYALQLFDNLKQMEGNVVSERTKEGLYIAKTKGNIGGRPPIDEEQIRKIVNMYFSNEYSVKDIVEVTGLARSTIYKYINKEKENRSKERRNKNG